MQRRLIFGLSLLLLSGCARLDRSGPSQGEGGAGPLPATIAEIRFAELRPWARPIDDYQQAGFMAVGSNEFLRGIHDLAVYEDRLYLAYGDADENLGSVIPIELRAFSSHVEATAQGEFETQEEQIERYRILDGELWVAGLDATEDGWLGNVYFRGQGERWVKSRTLDGGVLVQDVASFGGSHYAVGSGAMQQEWEAGDIYAHFWRSQDEGASFEVLERIHNGGLGDARYTRMLPVADQLYLFGFTSDEMFQLDDIINASFDGSTLTMLPDGHPLRGLFALETDVIAPDLGLLRALDIMAPVLRHTSYRVESTGPTVIDALVGRTLVDVFPHPETGEIVLLTYTGDEYIEGFLKTQWDVQISVTRDFSDFTELLSFDTFAAPHCVAFWRGALFYGDANGQVFRALRM